MLIEECGLPLLQLPNSFLICLLALRLHLPPKSLVLAFDRPRSFHGSGVGLDVVVNEGVILVIENVVFVLENDLHGRKNVESVIYAPLHILELDTVAQLFIQLENLVRYFGSRGHRIFANTFQNGSAQENKLLVLFLCAV